MEKVLAALKAQHECIQRLRMGMQTVEEEPKEATDIFSKIESMYQDAVFECGHIAASNNGFNSTPPNGAAS